MGFLDWHNKKDKTDDVYKYINKDIEMTETMYNNLKNIEDKDIEEEELEYEFIVDEVSFSYEGVQVTKKVTLWGHIGDFGNMHYFYCEDKIYMLDIKNTVLSFRKEIASENVKDTCYFIEGLDPTLIQGAIVTLGSNVVLKISDLIDVEYNEDLEMFILFMSNGDIKAVGLTNVIFTTENISILDGDFEL